jgi:2-keto-3-deoxy-L-rhamnonate aldolase RhmA
MSKLIALKEKLTKREPVLSSTIANLSWTGIIQKASVFPFDMMMFDLEHGTLSVESVEGLLRMCRLCDLPSIVRVPDCVPHLISKTLDMGADGVLIPRVERMEQVETAIRCARYYPRGRKGCGGFSNLRPEDKGSVEVYNDNRLIFIQMESREGLEILPQILETYGSELAGVLIGPYDASIMIGTPLDILSDTMTEYIRDVFAVCHQYGISCGSFVDGPALIPRYRDLGANVYWTGTDIGMLCTGFKATCDAFAQETAK